MASKIIFLKIFYTFFRGSTEINQGDAASSRKRAHASWGGSYAGNKDDYMNHTYSGVFLDSPSTTSATTYSLKHTDATNGGTYYINRSNRDYDAAGYDPRFVSNMILMEVTVRHEAIYELYPKVVRVDEPEDGTYICYDANDKKVTIDLDACKAKSDEMIAASATAKTAKENDAKNGNQKLLDLGLTQDEVTAMTGYKPGE